MEWILRAWRGEEKLWKVFWIYGILVDATLYALYFGLFYLGVIDDNRNSVVNWLFYIPLLIYDIWNWVSLWRCAFNSKRRSWGYITRIILLFSFWSYSLGCTIALLCCAISKRQPWTFLTSIFLFISFISYSGKGELPNMKYVKYVKSGPSQTEGPEEKYSQLCKKTMTDHAIKHGTNPEQYIAQNKTFVQQCVQYYMQLDASVLNGSVAKR